MSNITDISALAAKHGVQEIVLPGWDPQEPFVCMAKRPSLFNMAATGNVPNPLLKPIQTLFTASSKEVDEIPIAEQAKAIKQMARYALVKPTYDEIEAAGLELTDEQLLNIYAYAIGGARVLEGFRALLRGTAGNDGGTGQSEAVEPAGD